MKKFFKELHRVIAVICAAVVFLSAVPSQCFSAYVYAAEETGNNEEGTSANNSGQSSNINGSVDDKTTPGSGNDTTPGSGSGNDATLGSGNDTTPGSGNDTTSGSGNDTTSGNGNDTTPGSGNDTTPGSGNATTPGSGNDTTPGSGNDTTPGSGNDTTSGSGNDTTPGSGNDTTSGSGNDTTSGGGSGQGGSSEGGEPKTEQVVNDIAAKITPEGKEFESGTEITLKVADQQVEGEYTVAEDENNPVRSEEGFISGENNTYKLPSDKIGTYKFVITYKPQDSEIKEKTDEVEYKVFKTLKISDAVFEKTSDGTTDIVPEDGKTAGDYFSAGLPEGLKLTVDTSGWKYEKPMPDTPLNVDVAITGVKLADFKFTGDNAEYYKIDEKVPEVKGKIKPVQLSDTASRIDLTAKETSASIKLTDAITIKFDFNEENFVNNWINSIYEGDKFTFVKEIVKLDDNTEKEIISSVIDKEGNDYVLTENDGNQPVQAEDLYIIRNDVIYGPVSIKYNRDIQAPKVNPDIILTVKEKPSLIEDKLSWDENTKQAVPGIDFKYLEYEEGTAIIATKSDINITVNNTDSSLTAKVYISDTILSEEQIKALKKDDFKPEGKVDAGAGRKFVYVKVIDQAGNSAIGIVDGALLSDTNAPAIDNFVINEDNKTVSFSVYDGKADEDEENESGVQAVKVVVYNGDGENRIEYNEESKIIYPDKNTYTGQNDKKHNISIEVALPGNEKWIEVTATDYAGNESAPVASERFKIQGNDKVSFKFSPSVSEAKLYTSDTDSSLSGYYYKERSMTVSTETGFGPSSEGVFSYEIDGSKTSWNMGWNNEKRAYMPSDEDLKEVDFQEGKHTVEADLYNGLTVEGLGEGNSEFIVDKTAPVVEDVKVENYASYDDEAEIYYFGLKEGKDKQEKGERNIPVFTIEITEQHFDPKLAEIKIEGESSETVSPAWTSDGDKKHTAIVNMDGKGEGKYTLTVSCKDPVGWEAETKRITVILDYTNPVVTLSGSGDVPVYVKDETDKIKKGSYFNGDFTYIFTVNDNNFKRELFSSTVEYSPDGSGENVLKDPAGKGNEYVWEVKGKDGLADGTYWFTFAGKDLAGNLPKFKIEEDEKTYVSADDVFDEILDQNKTYKTGAKVLDTLAPVVTLSGNSSTKANYFESDDAAYFKDSFTYTFSVYEVNFRRGDYESNVEYTADGNGTSDLDKPVGEGKDFVWEVKGEKGSADGTYQFTFNGQDPAGNPAEFKIAENKEANIFANDVFQGVCKDKPYKTGKKILDTLAPVAEYFITENGLTYDNEDKDDKNTYFNTGFELSFTLDELHYVPAYPGMEKVPDGELNISLTAFKDGMDITDESRVKFDASTSAFKAVVNAAISKAAAAEQNRQKEEAGETPDVIADEGEYQFELKGYDKAGNAVTVKYKEQENGDTVADLGNDSTQTGIYRTGVKVVDITAPRYSLADMGPTSAEHVDGTTAYLKDFFTAVWTIDETYYSEGTIKAGLISVKDNTNYKDAAEKITWEKPGSVSYYQDKDGKYEVPVTSDGVYAFTIAGTDKAGNNLEPSDSEKAKTVVWEQTRKNGEGEYWTYAKVMDHTAPNAILKIASPAGTVYYTYRIGNNQGRIKDDETLFRKNENWAQVTVEGDDNSPVKISYVIKSAYQDVKAASSDYGHNQVLTARTLSSKQSFNVINAVITDKAGNVSPKPDPESFKTDIVYLDLDIPVTDKLAPSVTMSIAGHAVSSYGPDGQPLYKTPEFKFDISARDNDDYKSSSGLASVIYKIYVNNALVDTKQVFTYTDGVIQPNYSDTITLKVGDWLNYNNIRITAQAFDRSGHKSEESFITFGIDNTAPKIEVHYKNNDVKNGKYFKADRVAEITVTERNFREDLVKITTQPGARQSAWSQTKGGGNGDSTKWYKTITYNSDGDYTFDISAKDIVGWDAGKPVYIDSVATQEFTIDKTKPVITISFDNDNLKNTANGTEYYDAVRTATITVKEHNFGNGDVRKENIEASNPDSSKNFSKPGLSGWSNSGDNHSATVDCSQEGIYRITFNYTDMAGNEAVEVITPQYVVDTTKPSVKWVEGSVQDSKAYAGKIAPAVEVADTFMNWDGVRFELVGARNGKVTVTEQQMAHITDFLGQKSYNNFPVERKYDDIYTLTVYVKDLSGNEEFKKVVFSVNRFGSTWDYNNDPTTQNVVGAYYINTEKPLVIREVNPTTVTEWHAYVSHAGEYRELTEGRDYTVSPDTSKKIGWNQYIYNFDQTLFEQEGYYEVYVNTVDEARNPNSNQTVHGDGDEVYEMVPKFIVDKTNPRSRLTDATDTKQIRYYENEVPINIVPTDNYALARVDIYINNELRDSYFNDAENENFRLRDTLEANNNTIPWVLSSRDGAQTLRVECFDAAGNRSGYSIENEFVDNPEDPEIFTWNVVVSKNVVVQYVNNRAALAGTGLILPLLLLLLLFKRKKDEEKKNAAA